MPPVQEPDDFTSQSKQPAPGFVAEFIDFLKTNKKWWLTPIIIALVLLSGLLILAATGAAPLIYPLF